MAEGDADDDPELTIALGPVPLVHDPRRTPVPPALTRSQHKKRLRDANAAVARELVHRTGWSHAQVNAELNRLTGLRRVTEATIEELEDRLRHGERWRSRF